MRKVAAIVLLAIACISILWITRVEGLGDRPFSRDEYYSATTVQRVLEFGVPAFHGGGNYPRALPMQYATAALCKVFGENEGTHRILPALFGLLSIPLVYLMARRLMPLSVAVAVTVVFALSSWQIEFSRFARMYTTLQFLTLVFFYAFFLAYRERRRGWTYVPHVAALAAVSLHDLAVMLLPFLFLTPLIPCGLDKGARTIRRLKLIGAAMVTTGTAVSWLVFCKIWWSRGVVNPWPPGWIPKKDAGTLERLMEILSIPGVDVKISLVVFALLNSGIVAAILYRFRHDFERASLWIGAVVMIVAALFHQFALWGLAVAYLIWRHDLHRILRAQRGVAVAFTGSLVVLGCWTMLAWFRPEWLGGVDASDRLRAIRITFLGLPDFYSTGISPWFRAMPVFTTLAIAGAVSELLRIRRFPLRDLFWHPVWAVGAIAIFFGVTGLPLSTTRYWHFIYPFILLVPAMAVFHWMQRFTSRGQGFPGAHGAAAVIIGVFMLTEEFNLDHLLSPNRQDVVYRTGQFERFGRHWYPRSDERLPALELAKHAGPGTRIILSSMLTTSAYYFPESVKPAMYMPRDLDPRFFRHSRNGGTLDRWSGYRLLTDEEALRAYTAESTDVVIARVIHSPYQNFEPEEIWNSRFLSAERISISDDGRNEVLAIKLSKPL